MLDSPDQGVRGIPVDSVSVGGSEVVFGVAALQASYRGALLPGDMLVGVFRQGGMDFSLLLRRRDPAATARPGGAAAALSLCEPRGVVSEPGGGRDASRYADVARGERPAAAVVLVTGSGQQNRDEEVFGHKPFLVIADFLTRRGIAVLRYDDRGFGVPEEERRRLLERAATADFALDALGAFDFLRAQVGSGSPQVGILGHSEGGTVAFLAAAEEPRVAFVVSMAGWPSGATGRVSGRTAGRWSCRGSIPP